MSGQSANELVLLAEAEGLRQANGAGISSLENEAKNRRNIYPMQTKAWLPTVAKGELALTIQSRPMGLATRGSGYSVKTYRSGPKYRRYQERINSPTVSVPISSLKRRELSDDDFQAIISSRLTHVFESLKQTNRDLGSTADGKVEDFLEKIRPSTRKYVNHSSTTQQQPLYDSLRRGFVKGGIKFLDKRLESNFRGYLAIAGFSKSEITNQTSLANLCFPLEWYPATRALQRTIHLHIGPTNSGKTYHALKRLEQASSGLYAGPLRLLAHEVYTRLNSSGKKCNLITGDEIQFSADTDTFMNSYTVEMVPINTKVEVAVIDEIQMMGHQERGWAWTQALLGVQAEEVHVCGEERALPLVRELAVAMGDRLEVHQYRRLSPLKAMTKSLDGDLKNLRKGDCVVSFSRLGIHTLKKDIERVTGKRVAVVYGSLPPETRAQQARLFNEDGNDYDILVASDAIGMGLNLNIKRIVFEAVTKFDGKTIKALTVPEIKQIAGRAGRYRTALQDQHQHKSSEIQTKSDMEASNAPASKALGLVTTIEKDDLLKVQEAMQIEAPPILTAGLFPPATVIQRFAAYFSPEIPLSTILMRLYELARVHQRFHLCDLIDHLEIAENLEPISNLTIQDRILFMAAPACLKDIGMPAVLTAFAKCVANQGGGALLDIPEVNLEMLDEPEKVSKEYLGGLETLHKSLILYLWLSYRFAGVFISRPMAFYVKTLVEAKIDKTLAAFSARLVVRRQTHSLLEQTMLQRLSKQSTDKDIKDKAAKPGLDLPIRLVTPEPDIKDKDTKPGLDLPIRLVTPEPDMKNKTSKPGLDLPIRLVTPETETLNFSLLADHHEQGDAAAA